MFCIIIVCSVRVGLSTKTKKLEHRKTPNLVSFEYLMYWYDAICIITQSCAPKIFRRTE